MNTPMLRHAISFNVRTTKLLLGIVEARTTLFQDKFIFWKFVILYHFILACPKYLKCKSIETLCQTKKYHMGWNKHVGFSLTS